MNIGIIGLGLIGGSLGLDLLAANQDSKQDTQINLQKNNYVWGVSRNPETCKQAEAIAAVNIANTNIENIPNLILAQTEIVVICTPISSILPTIKGIASKLPRNVTFTDVGSVKSAIVEPASKTFAEFGQRFVGSHPMAGNAFQGLLAAERNLFQNRPCVVTPSDDLEALEKVRSLWLSVGMNVIECSPEEHDRAVAMISHAPVMISASLIAACQEEDDAKVLKLAQTLASSGFRDTSRVGGGNPELGRLMAEYNQTAILRSLYTYQQSLQQVINLIESQEWDKLEAFLANTQRDRLFYVE
ncbi:MAG: prephenate/arogenate dehydrogenase [Pseudanabaena sp. M158S2SP1A06QC]|jgi:arogenate dehydrogenase (NADP+)|uniref:prephenate/arogenate dehydrogenase n=1 Tax=Pseudanabaena mucicola TaxID=71190 RepID=UPI002577B11B|nr:prephenate/arogenate dehydrogenase [Pseudanabaena mucicola]MCA6573204.1 prephenate/arogenate dehydrogenase [Pseudanabaena sp. M53BS1SP1A06MG]MCA6580454.1 prephenate/arogenate dehydrogenase [Pseudanabaena sp. M34BS1SP1A06MG]MCA6594683.1 prephenate/arogenate dehydrogenase [Pseudanabaena sp. M38BS1SP1A06MG]MCA6596566.1 prephenate/arogenate dehydrogenase [Pseudanabaena sp. M046S1SP1A06QC]MCA6612898.1 prephenate/arogenate dehydrogenase [Pseudanabaena sp. M158S2SP1A06QC]